MLPSQFIIISIKYCSMIVEERFFDLLNLIEENTNLLKKLDKYEVARELGNDHIAEFDLILEFPLERNKNIKILLKYANESNPSENKNKKNIAIFFIIQKNMKYDTWINTMINLDKLNDTSKKIILFDTGEWFNKTWVESDDKFPNEDINRFFGRKIIIFYLRWILSILGFLLICFCFGYYFCRNKKNKSSEKKSD